MLAHRDQHPRYRNVLTLVTTVVAASACSEGVVGEPLGQEGAHEHGVAAVSMVVEGAEATVTFRAPSGDLWGFERPPRSEEEADARRRALTSLEEGLIAALGIETRLGCTVRSTRWSGAASAPLVRDDAESDDGHEHEHEHAHAHSHEDEHAHDDDHGSDAEAEFELECEAPLAGTRLALAFSNLFETIDRLDLQIVSESQQFGRRVTADGTRIDL
jgi:hypothetical protein